MSPLEPQGIRPNVMDDLPVRFTGDMIIPILGHTLLNNRNLNLEILILTERL